ncbi:hypothetical protein PV02_09780 [Methanolobus chelungpuianus]|uniref:CAAX prenyl protease 2/Lysostaphin resistance protein A-like domain-containing protein n=1 Tax=Methanolobus chelungpuianus TaxID=502115 RepID=A0AAE3HC76_9EURY|nr:hypothetical protein [Methanolobus chelungpuianus]
MKLQPDNEGYGQDNLYRLSFSQSLSSGRTVGAFVLAIILAELLLFSGNVKGGISLHFLLLISIPLLLSVIRERETVYALQALMLLPLLRLVNVSMPISDASLLLFVVVYIPMLIPVYLMIRHQGLTDVQLGIVYERLVAYIPIGIVLGALLGAGEYLIIGSSYLIPGLSDPFILVFASVVFLYVGLIEEFIFRSLIQVKLEGLFGLTPGLLAASLLFGVMHSIYGEITEMAYIFVVGIVLGYLFQRTRSLPLVAVAHGVANIVLFVLLPLVML